MDLNNLNFPKDWTEKEIETFATPVRGGSPRPAGSPLYFNGNFIPWLTVASLTNIPTSQMYVSKTDTFLTELGSRHSRTLDQGTLIIANSGATLGIAKILSIRVCANDGIAALLNIDKEIDLRYVVHFINSITRRLREDIATGNGQPNLNTTLIGKIRVPLPPTKSEQTAIATALSDNDALTASLEKLITKKRLIKHGVMQEMLEPKKGWEEKTLGESATIKARIGWQGLTTAEYKKNGDYFLITGTEFKGGFINWNECHYVDASRYNQDKNIQVKEHDILLTKDGTIGKVALIKTLPKKATLNSGVFVLRPIGDSFHPDFFYYLLLSEFFLRFLKQLSAGSTINHLYQKDIVSFKFFTPKTISEQKEIARVLGAIDDEIELLEKKLEKSKKIKQGMIQTLLTGKIRLV